MKMTGEDTYGKIYSFALALVVFFQTVFPKLVPLSIIILLLVILFGAVKGFLKWNTNLINVLFVGLYLCYFIAAFYTKDSKLAMGYLENKLSFVLFPLLFSFKPNFTVQIKAPAIGLIFGVIVVACWGIYKILSCLSNGSFIDCFSYFSDLHHPSYFAVYILLSMSVELLGYT